MNNNKRIITDIPLLFCLLVIIDIAGIVARIDLLHYIAKPLLMPALIAWLITQKKSIAGKPLILAALFASWSGDVLLLFEKNGAMFFIGGLVSFLLAHIFYTWYFLKIRSEQKSFLKIQPWWFVIVTAYGVGLVWMLYPDLGDMKLPVMVYAAVICTMLLCSLHAFNSISIPSRWYFVIGAILFVASDSLLAVNKFYQPFQFAGSLIMLTYCAAQFLIINAVICRK